MSSPKPIIIHYLNEESAGSQGLSAVVGGLEALQGEGVVFFGACVVQGLRVHAFAYFFSVWEVEWE